MTIAMNGTWIVSVKSKNAAWPQRYRIEGSSNGKDGVYSPTTAPMVVSGNQWGITVEHNPSGPISWSPSRMIMANFSTGSGQFQFDIRSDDTKGDADFNDLVLTCSMPLSSSDYVVYGTARSYSGWCWWNPCYPLYIVIESYDQLRHLLQFAQVRDLLAKLYPERIKRILKRPFPEPDPPRFKPMMIPTAQAGGPGFRVSGRNLVEEVSAKKGAKKEAPKITMENQTTLELVLDRPHMELARPDLAIAASLLDRLRLKPCTVSPISQTLMRFVEYDRTDAEKLGGPYTGDGDRTVLGDTATDEQGNYVFRFTWSLADIADEFADVAAGENAADQLQPDLLIQLLESLPDGVAWESAPHFNVPNVKRINLCIPESALGRPPAACQSGRAIQAIGNLFIVPHAGTTLHADGTISNTAATGPQVEHAAWRGTLDLFACFLDFRDSNDNPEIAYYTIRYRRRLSSGWETGWHFVNEHYTHLKQQTNGTWQSSLVGPFTHTVEVDGTMTSIDEVYRCIEENPAWLFTHRDRKIQLHTGLYQSEAGEVDFKIEGYDSSGAKISGAEDTVRLYLDNDRSTGEVDYVKFGPGEPEECAMYDLPEADSPLDVRFKAVDTQGFMLGYSLSVFRGSNTSVPIVDSATSGPVSGAYQDVPPYRYQGTLEVSLDGWRVLQIEPASGNWLPSGRDFCAFSFELSVQDRTTNGYGTPSSRTVYRELIGLAHEDDT